MATKVMAIVAQPRHGNGTMGQWEAYYGGCWRVVPADVILRDELNKVRLHAHICERAGFVYCFLRGGSGS
jgi:hypothetical protein